MRGYPPGYDTITVIVPEPGDLSHVWGTFRFKTWVDAAKFVGKLAEIERGAAVGNDEAVNG